MRSSTRACRRQSKALDELLARHLHPAWRIALVAAPDVPGAERSRRRRLLRRAAQRPPPPRCHPRAPRADRRDDAPERGRHRVRSRAARRRCGDGARARRLPRAPRGLAHRRVAERGRRGHARAGRPRCSASTARPPPRSPIERRPACATASPPTLAEPRRPTRVQAGAEAAPHPRRREADGGRPCDRPDPLRRLRLLLALAGGPHRAAAGAAAPRHGRPGHPRTGDRRAVGRSCSTATARRGSHRGPSGPSAPPPPRSSPSDSPASPSSAGATAAPLISGEHLAIPSGASPTLPSCE